MRMPFVRSALDSATQVARLGCEAIVDLEYQQSYSDNFADLTGWTVVENTAGNVSVSDGVLSILGDLNTLGVNGVWRAVSGVPGYVKFTYRVTGTINNNFIASVSDVAALPTGVVASRPLLNMTTSGLALRVMSLSAGLAILASDTDYVIEMRFVANSREANNSRYEFIIDGFIHSVLTTQANPIFTANSKVSLQSARISAIPKISNYEEHFGGFATTPQPVTYIADAGTGKKWNNFNLTNMAFDYALSSPNATFKYYYGDDVSPTWSSALTLANLKAVGALTTQYRYAMIQVLQNSDGLVQCPVTEVNATDATDGQAATAGGGAQLGAFETGAWR